MEVLTFSLATRARFLPAVCEMNRPLANGFALELCRRECDRSLLRPGQRTFNFPSDAVAENQHHRENRCWLEAWPTALRLTNVTRGTAKDSEMRRRPTHGAPGRGKILVAGRSDDLQCAAHPRSKRPQTGLRARNSRESSPAPVGPSSVRRIGDKSNSHVCQWLLLSDSSPKGPAWGSLLVAASLAGGQGVCHLGASSPVLRYRPGVMAWDTGLDKGSVAYSIASAVETRVRVIAGPGTGKSFAMKRRVARLLESGVAPKELLAVTFTRVAAEDLHRELQKLGVPGCEELEGQTLHSLAMRVLSRKHVLQAVGRSPRPLNTYEVKALICDVAVASGGKRRAKTLIAGYTAAWAQSQGDEPGFAKTPEEKAFQAALLAWLEFHEGMLIGELIPYLVRYLKDNPAAAEHSEFKYLLIDEYQDLNKAEQTAIAYLGESAEICIVGDDDQSIYSFKCAHPDGIREWKTIHPKCADLNMADCHRCPTTVVVMANALISVNTNREPRELSPLPGKGAGEVAIVQLPYLEDEATWIAEKVAALLARGVHPSEIIILVQRAVAGRPILNALKAAGLPAKSYYDESQLDSEAAQERFAVFKLFLNNEDRVALRYFLGSGAKDFRAKAYARFRQHCETSGETPWVAMNRLAEGSLKIPYTGPLVGQFLVIKEALNALEAVKGDLGTFVDGLFPEDDSNLSELRELALEQSDEVETPKDLLSAMMQQITQPDIPPTVEEVRLMSLHKSKGLSSPYVFIAGCVEGILPPYFDDLPSKAAKDAALEEARRLFYVGITRVKADPENGRPGTLFITYAQQMPVKDAYGANVAFKTQYGAMANLLPSRFIGELGPAAPKPVAG